MADLRVHEAMSIWRGTSLDIAFHKADCISGVVLKHAFLTVLAGVSVLYILLIHAVCLSFLF